MPRFNANLSMMFTEEDFLDRFAAAAKAGFSGVEYLFTLRLRGGRPGEPPAGQRPDPGAAQPAGRRLGRRRPRHRRPAGPGGRVPRRRGAGAGLRRGAWLPAGQLLAGIAPAEADPGRMRDTLVENLGFAADRLKSAGIELLIEAINTRDIPGFFLNGTEQAAGIIDDVGSDNLFSAIRHLSHADARAACRRFCVRKLQPFGLEHDFCRVSHQSQIQQQNPRRRPVQVVEHELFFGVHLGSGPIGLALEGLNRAAQTAFEKPFPM